MFKKTKVEEPKSRTEEQLELVNSMLDNINPTDDEYTQLLADKERLTNLLAKEDEMKRKSKEHKFVIDPNIAANLVATLIMGAAAVKFSEGRIVSGPIWDKFRKRM